MLSSTWLGGLLLLDTVSISLGGGSGAVATTEEDPSPILSTLEGPLAGILSSKGASTPLGAPSDIDQSLVAQLRESIGIIA